MNPQYNPQEEDSIVEKLINSFGHFIKASRAELKVEIEKWKLVSDRDISISNKERSIRESMDLACGLPKIKSLLTLLTTLPASNASAERGFSKLENIKTIKRTTMSQTRLNSIALISSNRDLTPSIQEILTQFRLKSYRRLEQFR